MEIPGVTESVAQHLRQKIILGELESGARLNEVQLAEAFGVSRPPLREALRLLERDHLVTCIPRKGSFVAPLSVDHFDDIFAARRMIETFAIEIFAQKGIRKLDAVRETLQTASELAAPDPDDTEGMLLFWKTFSDFHLKLVDSSHNPYLQNFYRVISLNLARCQVMYLKIPGSWKDSIKHHRSILASIEKGNYVRARDLLVKHLDMTLSQLKTSIQKARDHRVERAGQ
ncbi:MAG: GntR family transcriptional regulator [Deltaproteobacteria bacterium]